SMSSGSSSPRSRPPRSDAPPSVSGAANLIQFAHGGANLGDAETTVFLPADRSPSDPRSEESRASLARIGRARAAGSEPGARAPSGPTAARDFLAARLALFGRSAFLASSAFLLMGFGLNALAKREVVEAFPAAHLVATASLLLIWILARRGFSRSGLLRLDASATIFASFAYIAMALTIPPAWRPDLLVSLILNAVLLGRPAPVPGEPR